MVKKTFVIPLVLCMALAGTAFASGQKEPPAAAPGQGASTETQKLVLTGPVAYQNLIHPTLKSGGKVYELLVPRYLVYRAGLKEGAQVTVEGYQVANRPWAQDDGNVNVLVTKATIDGKDYDLSQFRGPGYGSGGRGWGRGMMGGYGPGWGMMGGYGRGWGMRGGYGPDGDDFDGPGCGF